MMASNNEDFRPGSFDTEHDVDLLAETSGSDEGQADENVVTRDAAVWCEECGIHNIGDCFIHGGTMTVTLDNAMPTRACLSLPKILALKRVRDSDPCSLEAKRGVFSKKFIKLRTLFGPMEAKTVFTKPKLQTGMMEYQLLTNEKSCEFKYLDITDENSSNWMMFVRPANIFAEQNMAAFQDKGSIFFVTCKNIQKGTELRVWYAAAYAKAIGKRILLPEQADRKPPLSGFKNEKISLQEQLHNTLSPATSQREHVKDLSEKCRTESTGTDNNIKSEIHVTTSTVLPEKSTRSIRAMKDNSGMFSCNTCNTTFTKLGQLDSHICKELGEGEDDSLGCGTRRRKGRPRKLLDSDDSTPSGKLAKIDSHDQEACTDIISGDIPNEGITRDLNGESSEENAKLYNDIDAGITILPSTALIPTTTTELSGDDEENQPSLKNKRGPGRPKGSKNKNVFISKSKPAVKTETSVSKRQIYSCEYCEKFFTSHELFVVHEASHFNVLPYTCDYPDCGKSFNSKFKHQRHLAVHEKPKTFPCKFCPSTFNRVDHLKNHLLVHDSNRNTFTCAVCGKSYLYKTNLTFHMAKHEADEGNTLNCLVCNKKFELKEQLKLHVNSHNRYKKEKIRLRKHGCSLCLKLFTTAKDIRRHMLTHSKERHFLCEHCPQTFVRKDHLRRHYTSHHKKEFYESQLKDSPYGCSTCLLVFKKKDFLDYHMKSYHPEGIKIVESVNRKEKAGKLAVKLAVSESSEEIHHHHVVKVSKDSQNQLAKLLQKRPIQKPDVPPQQFIQFASKAQQPLSISQQPVSFPLNVMKKIEQGNNKNANSRPYAIVYPASLQSTAPLVSMYDSNELIPESFTAPPTKTVPFRFQNQLVSPPQLLVQNTAQLNQLHSENQQQESQQQIQEDQQSLLNHIQMQQQQQQAQVQQQQQFQQQQLHQQLQQQQSVTPLIQGMQVDILNSLAGLNQVQDMPGNSNTNFVNIITFDGHNFLVGPGQVLDLNKPVQVTVIKDQHMESKQTSQVHPQTHGQQLGVKQESTNLIYPLGQVLRGSISKPDHCYASASLTNPTLSNMLENQNKSQLSILDKSSILQGPSITDEEATRIMAQIKNTGSSVGAGSNLSENSQAKNELLMAQQQQLHHQHLQQLHQDQFQQQENHQQEQQQQQQPLQNLSSFTLSWSDGLSDYTPVTELPVSGDITTINQGEGLGTMVSGSTPASWILQLPATMLDQPQIQQLQSQHLTNSHVVNVTLSGPVNDS